MSNCSFKVQDVINEANEILEKARKKNAKELSMAVVKPLDKQYPFSTNGIYLVHDWYQSITIHHLENIWFMENLILKVGQNLKAIMTTGLP